MILCPMVAWMRKRLGFVLVGLSLLGSGCSLVTDATCLTIFTVKQTAEDFGESVRNRRWAEFAWEDAKRADLHKTYSEDYACGFKDGFAHYLYRGGHGEPPPLPPAHYRKVRYQTPEGYKAIEDWFGGFRHGAAAARQSGYRYWITGPSALRCAGPLPTLPTPEHHPASSAPALSAPELAVATLERPIPLPMPPPPAPLPPRPQTQRSSAPQRQSAPPLSTLPRPQTQRPGAVSAPPVTMPLPTILNGDATRADATKRDAKPLPTIINGDESVGRSP